MNEQIRSIFSWHSLRTHRIFVAPCLVSSSSCAYAEFILLAAHESELRPLKIANIANQLFNKAIDIKSALCIQDGRRTATVFRVNPECSAAACNPVRPCRHFNHIISIAIYALFIASFRRIILFFIILRMMIAFFVQYNDSNVFFFTI